MTPEQAIRLLSVEEWPPKLEHWPPRDKSQWRPGMFLQGIIQAVMTLPRPEGSKRRGEPYLVMYVRRLDNNRLVMWHGWHTAAEDVPAMGPAPGLLFTTYYRGERDNGYEDFKQLVTPYDPPAQQTRQETGQAERPRSAQAPESEGAREPSPSPSGSNQPVERPAPGEAARQAGGVTDNGRPTEHAIAWLGRLSHDSDGLFEARELLMATSTAYRGVAKVAAERHYEAEDGWRRLWNDTDLDNWVTVLQGANWQAAKLLDGKTRRRPA